jgi:hypothetical protein
MIFAYVINEYERPVVFKLGKIKGAARGSAIAVTALAPSNGDVRAS